MAPRQGKDGPRAPKQDKGGLNAPRQKEGPKAQDKTRMGLMPLDKIRIGLVDASRQSITLHVDACTKIELGCCERRVDLWCVTELSPF